MYNCLYVNINFFNNQKILVMSKYSEEELKKMYEEVEGTSITEKMRDAMMVIISLKEPGDGQPLFNFVMENFTEAEKTHMACTHIAKHMKEMMDKNPDFVALLRTLKKLKEMKEANFPSEK